MNRMTQISRMTKFYFLLIFIAFSLMLILSFCQKTRSHEVVKKARKGYNSCLEIYGGNFREPRRAHE